MPTAAQMAGKQYVRWLGSLTAALLVIYVVGHLTISPGVPSLESIARLDPSGQVVITSPVEFDWWVRKEQGETVLKAAATRSAAMGELHRKLVPKLRGFLDRQFIGGSDRSGACACCCEPGEADVPLMRLVNQYEYAKALRKWDHVLGHLSGGTLDDPAAREAKMEIDDSLSTLQQLRTQQWADFEGLTPKDATVVFWCTPWGQLAEVVAWSLFGILANLLINSTEHLRTGEFSPIERWVSVGKFLYGPLISVALFMAIWNGWFDLGGYQTRAWTVPLVGFFFGYAGRRSVLLLDRLVSKVFGEAERSIDDGPSILAQKRRERIGELAALSAKSETLGQLRADLKALGQAKLAVTVAEADIQKRKE